MRPLRNRASFLAGPFTAGSVHARACLDAALGRDAPRPGFTAAFQACPSVSRARGHPREGGTASLAVTIDFSLTLCSGLFWGAWGSSAPPCAEAFVAGRGATAAGPGCCRRRAACTPSPLFNVCRAGTLVQLRKRQRSQTRAVS